MIRGWTLLATAVFILVTIDAHAAGLTVDAIRKAGALTCGVDQSEAEYSITDEHGSRLAFDRDLCTAVAVAILGAPKVVIKGFPDEDTAFEALQNGEVDMVASVSDDFTHSTIANIALTRPVLQDWQGLMVPRASKITHARSLAGKHICFLSETETEDNLRAWFKERRLSFVPFPFQEEGEMEAAFITGNCAALAGDATRLANTRVAFGKQAPNYILLPDVLSQDPLAAAYRRNDPAFGNIIQWTFEVLLLAEEQHVTAKNIGILQAGANPTADRLLDIAHSLGKPLALHDGWPMRVIQAVGNYGEIYGRDVGMGSPLKLPRNLPGQTTNAMQSLPLKYMLAFADHRCPHSIRLCGEKPRRPGESEFIADSHIQ